jgi:hypothetical protein
VVCCPLCHVNLDLKQAQINSFLGTKYEVPILYLPQVLGLALGLSEKDVMLQKNVVDPKPLIERAIAEGARIRAEEEKKAKAESPSLSPGRYLVVPLRADGCLRIHQAYSRVHGVPEV